MNSLGEIRSQIAGSSLSKRTSRAYVNHADTAPGFWMIGILWRMLATGVQTGNAMCLLDQFCPPGSGPARHAHPQEEGLYVLQGKVSFNAGDTSFQAVAGSFVTIPRHTEHSFLIDDEAILINFYFPAGFDLWLMGSAVPAQRNELPPQDLAPPVYEVTKRLSDDYGGVPLTEERSTSANPDAPALPTINTRTTADNFWFQNSCWSILAEGTSTGGSYSVFEVELQEGPVDQPHIHDRTDDVYYIFEGELNFSVDAEIFNARKGSFVFVPRGSVHSFEVTSKTARLLNIHTEPGYERVIRAFGSRVSEASLPTNGWHEDEVSVQSSADIYSDIGFRRVAPFQR